MIAVFKKTLEVIKAQWQLTLFTVILAVIFQMDYGFGDENFGFIILLGIPFLFWIIFTFVLTKLIHHQLEHKKTKLKELLKMYIDWTPKLILPMIVFMFLIVCAMGLVITLVYIIFAMFGISNAASIFESKPTDLNYILFYLVFSILMSFLIYQPVIYFLEKRSFFSAFKDSIKFGRKHLQFTAILGLIYFAVMMITGLFDTTKWYFNLVLGIISGLEYYFMAVASLLFYQKVKD